MKKFTDKPKNEGKYFCDKCKKATNSVVMIDSAPHCGSCLSERLEELFIDSKNLERANWRILTLEETITKLQDVIDGFEKRAKEYQANAVERMKEKAKETK